MKRMTLENLKARRAVVAAQAERHALKHDSKRTLGTAERYAARLARLDARILKAAGLSDECPRCSRIGAGPLCKDHREAGPDVATRPDLIAAVRAHAAKHYAAGWDVVIEAYDDADIATAIDGATSAKDAIRMMARRVSAQSDYRKDVEAEADVERPDHDTRDREGRDEPPASRCAQCRADDVPPSVCAAHADTRQRGGQ